MSGKGAPAGDFFFVPGGDAQETEDLRQLLKMPAGRRLFRRLLSASNAMRFTFTADARSTDYNLGLQAVGLWLAAKIETAAPGEIPRLMLESSMDRQAARSARGAEKRHHNEE